MRRARLRLAALAAAFALAAPLAAAQEATPEEFARRQYESGVAFMQEQKYAEALKDFQAVVENYPASRVADAALLQIAGYQLDVQRNLDAAQGTLDVLLKKYPTSDSAAMALVLGGRLLLARSRSQGSVDAALSSFDRVSHLYPGSEAVAAAGYETGEALRLAGRDADAMARYRDVSLDFRRSTWAARAMLGEARCLVTAGKSAQAMELLQRVHERFPGTPEAGTAISWNTILYRLYVRAPGQPAYRFADRTLAGRSGRLPGIDTLAVDALGTVFAAGGGATVSFEPAGRMQGPFAAADPVGVGFDPAGRPIHALKRGLVRDGKTIALSVRKADGRVQALEDLTAIAVRSSGELLVADKGTKSIGRFSPDGMLVDLFSPLGALRLAIDDADRVTVLQQDGRIALLDADGRTRTTLAPRGQGYEIDKAVDVALDPLGHLYVLDRGQGAVHVFATRPTPRFVATFSLPRKAPGAFREARALCVDRAGRLYIFDEDAERIQVYQ